MPALKTFHDNKNIYSVDMMVAYVNAFEHPIVKLPIEQLVPQLKEMLNESERQTLPIPSS